MDSNCIWTGGVEHIHVSENNRGCPVLDSSNHLTPRSSESGGMHRYSDANLDILFETSKFFAFFC